MTWNQVQSGDVVMSDRAINMKLTDGDGGPVVVSLYNPDAESCRLSHLNRGDVLINLSEGFEAFTNEEGELRITRAGNDPETNYLQSFN